MIRNMHLIRLLLPVFSFLISSVSFGESPREFYDQKKYQDALEALNKQGLTTSADYYNAGNIYYRLGKTGQALAYYEKARALSPNNPDIKYNQELVQETLEKNGALAKDQSLWSGRIVPLARNVPEIFVDLLLFITTIGLALAARRAKLKGHNFKKALTDGGFMAAVGIWALSCAFVATAALAHRTKLAAIVADLSVARSGPSETFTELFKLPAGSKVEVTGESREGWKQVRFSLGNVGWIMEKDLLEL